MSILEIILTSIVVGGPFAGSAAVYLLHRLHRDAAADWVAAKAPLFFHAVQVIRSGAPRVLAAPADQRASVILDELAELGASSEDERVVRLAAMARAVREKKPTPALVPPLVGGLLVMALLAGCGLPAATLRAIQVESQVIVTAEPCLVSAYRAEQEACVSLQPTDADRRACVADVRARWKPIVDELAELRDARCKIEPAKCPTEGK